MQAREGLHQPGSELPLRREIKARDDVVVQRLSACAPAH
jgi:hypothetical protein